VKNSLLIACLTIVFMSGCVSFELRNVVSDTVEAGKTIYQTIRRKANGEEEREYSHTMAAPPTANEITQIKQCKQQIELIISDSGYQIEQIISQSSETSVKEQEQVVKCTLLVVVVRLVVVAN
jgi:hypothetical protein